MKGERRVIRRIYEGSGNARLIYEEFVPEKEHQVKTIRLYARDLMDEINLIISVALFVFGGIFAVPMVRHEIFYILYWTGTAVFTFRCIWKKYRPKPKKKSHNRARVATQKH